MLLIDGHNDLPWQLRTRFGNRLEGFDFRDARQLVPPIHTDLRRLREGGVGAQFWALYVPIEHRGAAATKVLLEQLDVTERLHARHPELRPARTADEIEAAATGGGIASVLAVEGGHALDDSPAVLRLLARLGVRYLTLTHNANTGWADSCSEPPAHGGLNALGREIVAEMNRLGVLVDLSHASDDTMRQAIETSRVPVLFTHSGARALTDHPRNVPDAILHRVRDTGGVVMATFVPTFVSSVVRAHHAAHQAEIARLATLHPADVPRRERELTAWLREHPTPRATVADVADHIDYLLRVLGPEHVGIGSDFDGIPQVPDGLDDVSCYPNLFAELRRRGHEEATLAAIAGANVLRALRAAERFAAASGGR